MKTQFNSGNCNYLILNTCKYNKLIHSVNKANKVSLLFYSNILTLKFCSRPQKHIYNLEAVV